MKPTPAKAIERYVAVVDTPVVAHEDVPTFASACGIPEFWKWLPREPKTDDAVYFAGALDGVVKIGCSRNPAWRLHAMAGNPHCLPPLLVIVGSTFRHEKAIHRLFAAERVTGEFFSGPRLALFVGAAQARSSLSVGDCAFAGYLQSRVRFHREMQERKTRRFANGRAA